ncbi:MAG: hypothetical protein WD206_03885 [Actinomycetota bacterium]
MEPPSDERGDTEGPSDGRGGRRSHKRPWWAVLLVLTASGVATAVWPLRRMWRSDNPLDGYALVNLASVGGDVLVAVALANSVFFSIPVGEAEGEVALYLLLTMAPLAVAGPLLVPVLDRAGPRRAITVAAAAARAFLALYAAPRTGSLLLFPAVFLLLAGSRVHGVSRSALVLAYAGPGEGLVRANARLGRVAAVGAVLAAVPGIVVLRLFGDATTLYLASFVYGATALLMLRLPQPRVAPTPRTEQVGKRGRIASLATPAIGAMGLRAANGFMIFLLAFALRREGQPAYWFGVLFGAGVIGVLLADVLAPRLPNTIREELVVVGCVAGAGLGALLAFQAFTLPMLALFGLAVGGASELGRLAFQSLMQRQAPEGALGRVFVRYEVQFQLAWVAGALLPALLPIEFRGGILVLAAFYAIVAVSYLLWPRIERGLASGKEPGGRGPPEE